MVDEAIISRPPPAALVKKPIVTTLAGLAALGLGTGGLAFWLTSAWFHDPGPYPVGWAGYFPAQFAGLFLFTVCTTIGYVLMYVGITTGARVTEDHDSALLEAAWVGLLGMLATVSIGAGAAGLATWGYDSFMNCAAVFCIHG